MDTEVGGIHNPADVHISEILTPVLKRHPVSWDTRKAMFLKKKTVIVNQRAKITEQNLPVI